MAQSVGALVAELSANTASFQKDMGKAAAILNSNAAKMNKTVAGIEKSISRVGTAFLTVFSAAAMLRFSKNILDMGDQFAKLSQKTGISVEKLSEFAHGARLSNVSVEEMAGGLRKLAVNMAEAATNGAGQMAESFRAVGISVTDSNGALRDTSKVFEELSARFASAEDGPEKAAIAVKLLGESGESLIPLMNGLSQTSEEARRLGLIMSSEAAKQAEAFNDEMSRLAIKLQMTVLPAITAVSKAIRSLMGSDDLDILQAKRAKAAAEYSQLIEAGMSRNSARIVLLLHQIDELDAKIIESNKRIIGSGTTAPKGKLPPIANVGQVNQYQSLLQEIEKATRQSQLSMTTDEKANAYERMAIARDEIIFKAKQLGLWAEEGKKVTAQQMEIQRAFGDWIRQAENEAAFKARTPLETLTDDWKNATKQMEQATASWAESFADTLTDFVTTGKANFKDFANAIIRDLVRISIQKKLTGLFSASGEATFIGAVGSILGFAGGGNPPIGKASVVGENGPELIVPRSPMTVIPNGGGMGGAVYNIDARGADREGLTRLEGMIRQLDGSIEHRSVSAWVKDRSRGGPTAAFG